MTCKFASEETFSRLEQGTCHPELAKDPQLRAVSSKRIAHDVNTLRGVADRDSLASVQQLGDSRPSEEADEG